MGYKVLTDGNGGPVIRVVGLGDFIRFEAHNAERDALAAQLKHQNERAEMAEIFIEQLATELGAGATVAEVVDRVAQWLDADHGERLAEVRADAIKQAAGLVLMAAQVPPANTIPDDLFRAGIRCGAALLIARAEKMRGGAV